MSHASGGPKVCREPPARATVLVGNKPSEYVEVAFPWELNNTDYLRRILGQVTLSLRPLYQRAVTVGGCVKVRTGDNYEIDPRRADAFYILKHIIENHEHYVEALEMQKDDLEECVMCLRSARNRLAHEEDDLQGVSWEDLSDAFVSSEKLAASARCRFAQTNLMRLRRQCEEHQESKDLRQQDQSTRVLVGALEGTSNEGAAGSSNGNSAEAGPRPSRQWWLDDDDEWGAGSLPLQLVPRSLDARPALTSAAHGGSAATAASTRGSSTTFRPRILSRQHREGSSASTSGAQSQHNHNNGIAAKPPNIMKRPSSHQAADGLSSGPSSGHSSQRSSRKRSPSSPFKNMKLRKGLAQNILSSGFSVPSAVQHHGIAASVSGRHVVFAARHGSGRTTAACISVLNNLKADTDGCQALILTPSREEGELVQSLVEALGAGLAEGRKTVTCHACGSRKEEDARILQGSGVQVVAGKPDHVKDMLDQHFMQPRSIKMLVIEDADELARLGFKDEIYDIFRLLQPPKLLTRQAAASSTSSTGSQAQVILTCTSLPPVVEEIIGRFSKDPLRIDLLSPGSEPHPADSSAQFFLNAATDADKLESLRCFHTLLERSSSQGVIFVSTPDAADQLSQVLQDQYGIVVSLAQLLDSEQFAGVSSRLLVAVDEDADAIMKAGNMLLVINYHVPVSIEDSMERLKCSRGPSSVAINLISSREDERMLHHVQSLFNFSINRLPSSFLGMV